MRRVRIEESDGLGIHIAGNDHHRMVGHLAEESVFDLLEVRVTQEFATIHSHDHIMSLLQSRGYILQLAIVALKNRQTRLLKMASDIVQGRTVLLEPTIAKGVIQELLFVVADGTATKDELLALETTETTLFTIGSHGCSRETMRLVKQ